MRKKKTAKKHKSALPNLEKEFKRLSTKLIEECGKEITFLKQKTKEITIDLKKAKNLQQLANKKAEQLALGKSQWKSSEKKQWQATSKLQQELGKMIAASTTMLSQFENAIEKLELKKNQFDGLNDQLRKKQTATYEPLLQPPMFPTFQIFQD